MYKNFLFVRGYSASKPIPTHTHSTELRDDQKILCWCTPINKFGLKVCVLRYLTMQRLLCPLGTTVLTQDKKKRGFVVLQIHAWLVHTLCTLRGAMRGYTVPCTIDKLIVFGRDLLPSLPEAPPLWVTCGGGIPFLEAGDLPKPASHESEQHWHKYRCVNSICASKNSTLSSRPCVIRDVYSACFFPGSSSGPWIWRH